MADLISKQQWSLYGILTINISHLIVFKIVTL